jgi:hypothetical protein
MRFAFLKDVRMGFAIVKSFKFVWRFSNFFYCLFFIVFYKKQNKTQQEQNKQKKQKKTLH